MLLIRYRANQKWGGCHCHGPDHRRDSDFEVEAVESFDDAVERGAKSVVDDEQYATTDRFNRENSDYDFYFVRSATTEEVEAYEEPGDSRPKEYSLHNAPLPPPEPVEGDLDGKLARFDLRRAIAARVAALRAEKAAVEAEQERVRTEAVAKLAAERAEQKARADALAEREQYEKLRAKFESELRAVEVLAERATKIEGGTP